MLTVKKNTRDGKHPRLSFYLVIAIALLLVSVSEGCLVDQPAPGQPDASVDPLPLLGISDSPPASPEAVLTSATPPATPPTTPGRTAAASAVKYITIHEAYPLLMYNVLTGNQNPNFMVIDTRTPVEYAAGHIPYAVNIDMARPGYQDTLRNLDRSKTYLTYCSNGSRSAAMKSEMMSLGFQSVYAMTDGFEAWQGARHPTEK